MDPVREHGNFHLDFRSRFVVPILSRNFRKQTLALGLTLESSHRKRLYFLSEIVSQPTKLTPFKSMS